MQITREVTITVEGRELLKLLVDVLTTRALDEGTDPRSLDERTLYAALGNLDGRSDVEAVKQANEYADDHGLPHIRMNEFRKWLPRVLSEVFAEFLNTGIARRKGDERARPQLSHGEKFWTLPG